MRGFKNIKFDKTESMKTKMRIGVLFGGKSVEHEVSCVSASQVVAALNPNQFDVYLISIDKTGQWFLHDSSQFVSCPELPERVRVEGSKDPIAITFHAGSATLVSLTGNQNLPKLDVIFPILHGPLGEDGTVQGLLTLADIPFVGSGVLGSAVAMDKDVMKRLFVQAGLLTSQWVVLQAHERAEVNFDQIKQKLGLPLFVKPANAGSSVGISKVYDQDGFDQALDDAARYDHKIIVEAFIPGREIECSVLGNDSPTASLAGEVIPTHEFYSYAAKYLDDHGADLKVPVSLPDPLMKEIQETAIRAYKALCVEGMARVDFLLREDGALFLNEVNTIPGFTTISMYPKLWEASGLPYSKLLEQLIALALERHQKQKALSSNFEVKVAHV